MRFRPLLAAGLALAAGAVPLGGGRLGAPRALASGDTPTTGSVLALLAGRPGAEHTSLYLAPVGGSGAALAPVATFGHLPGAAVRGAVLPGSSTVVAIADTAPTRDASFAASLFLLRPHAPPERLVDGVVHASRPLVTPAGRVFVSRGLAGPETDALGSKSAPASMRIDQLSIDEIDPETGATRPVLSYTGFLAFLAGSFDNEVLVYRVGPAGADLVGVDADSAKVRVILGDLLPFARDFSVDEAARRIVFEERDEASSSTWVVDEANLESGARKRLYQSATAALAPHLWPAAPGADPGAPPVVALSPGGKAGMRLVGGGPALADPLGQGVDLVLATSSDGASVAALHTRPGSLPVPFAVETATGSAASVAAPPGARVTIAGFVGAGGAK